MSCSTSDTTKQGKRIAVQPISLDFNFVDGNNANDNTAFKSMLTKRLTMYTTLIKKDKSSSYRVVHLGGLTSFRVHELRSLRSPLNRS